MSNVQIKFVENIKSNVLCSIFFFRKSCHLWDSVEKYCRAGEATYDNMAHARCLMDTEGYKYRLRIHNTYRFSPERVVALTRLNVKLCVLCLSFYVWRVLTMVFTPMIATFLGPVHRLLSIQKSPVRKLHLFPSSVERGWRRYRSLD